MSFLSRIFRGQNQRTHSETILGAATRKATEIIREAQELQVRMYAAAQVNRLTADWFVTITSADAEIFVSRKSCIARARELERNNPYMRRGLRVFENNVVGANGIGLRSMARLAVDKFDSDYEPPLDLAAARAVQQAWIKAGEPKNCTVFRNMSRRKVCRIATRSIKRDGGVMLRKRRGFDNAFGFAVEPIEIDRLDHDLNRPANHPNNVGAVTDDQNEITFGIEKDKFGAPVAYHILSRHPGDTFRTSQSVAYRERVPADEIIAVFSSERFGQTVGMPDASAVMIGMNHLGRYDEAEVIAARAGACKGGFYKKATPEGWTGADDGSGNFTQQLQPGFAEKLPLGWEWIPYNPEHPTTAYPAFVKAQLRGIASGFGMSYHVLANDLEGISFSSIRQGTLEDREEYKTLQQDLIEDLLVPWFMEWLLFALMKGAVSPRLGVVDYERLTEHKWKPRTWDWVDPLSDVQADAMAIAQGFTSRSQVVAEYSGRDVEEVDHENQKDKECAERHGLEYGGSDASVGGNDHKKLKLPIDSEKDDEKSKTDPQEGGAKDKSPIEAEKDEEMKPKRIVKLSHARNRGVEWLCMRENCGKQGIVPGDRFVPEKCPDCGSGVGVQYVFAGIPINGSKQTINQ